MNLELTSGQLIVLLAGWGFALTQDYRSRHRNETLKKKDKIIDRIESLQKWLEEEIKNNDFSSSQAETFYSGKITQIEFKISQLNKHIRREAFSSEILVNLRNIDLEKSKNEIKHEIQKASFETTEEIETTYNEQLFSKKGISQFLAYNRHTLLGLAAGLSCITLLFIIFKLI
jgi:hypothetical protein